MTTSIEEARVSMIGGESRSRGFFGSLRLAQGAALVGLAVVCLILLIVTQSVVLLVLLAVLALGVFFFLRRRRGMGETWTGSLSEELRWRIARRMGTDRFEPETYATRPVPTEVGLVRFDGVAAAEGAPELCVASHGLEYLTTVLEVIGGGDGMHEIAETNVAAARFGAFLSQVSAASVPVDQIDLTTRVMPVSAEEYELWVAARLRPDLPVPLQESMTELAAYAAWSGEAYRSWMTLRMPRKDLTAKVLRRGLPANPETIAEMAYEVTADVSRLATNAGLRVRQGMGPRRLGALVRHLYAPSVSMDDLAGLSGARDGFMPYDATGPGARTGFPAEGPDGSTWWHATMTVPRDGLPLNPVIAGRWLECLVTDVTPPVIRTVTSQFQLVTRAQARARAASALTLDRAAMLRDAKRGVVSTGEKEAQAAGPQMILDDLLIEHAAGANIALRVTVSARSAQELLDAREVVETAAHDGGISRVRWHDTRHHHAHVLTLPLAKGIS